MVLKAQMSPVEAMRSGLDAGAASVRIEMNNGALAVYHGTRGNLLLKRENVKAGTWTALWNVLYGDD